MRTAAITATVLVLVAIAFVAGYLMAEADLATPVRAAATQPMEEKLVEVTGIMQWSQQEDVNIYLQDGWQIKHVYKRTDRVSLTGPGYDKAFDVQAFHLVRPKR